MMQEQLRHDLVIPDKQLQLVERPLLQLIPHEQRPQTLMNGALTHQFLCQFDGRLQPVVIGLHHPKIGIIFFFT